MHPLWHALVSDPRFNRYRAVLGARIHEDKYAYLFVAPGVRLQRPTADLAADRCLHVWPISAE